MSLAARNYSKDSRSSSYYSRSSSYHTSANDNSNISYRYHYLTDDRPLSTRLIERDYSSPSLAWSRDFDDPFFFDRFPWRFDNDFWKFNFGLGRHLPIYYRSWNSSSARVIPIQYTPSSSSIHRRQDFYKKSDNTNDSTSSFSKRHDESSMMRENRIPSDDWPQRQEPSTRKRTSMTIFVQRPYIDQCEVPYYRQTLPTPTYPQSARIDYY